MPFLRGARPSRKVSEALKGDKVWVPPWLGWKNMSLLIWGILSLSLPLGVGITKKRKATKS